MSWPCFMLKETDYEARWLRRFTFGPQKDAPNQRNAEACPANVHEGYNGGHDAAVRIENGAALWGPYETTPAGRKRRYHLSTDDWPRDDPRWPTTCRACGQPLSAATVWQLFSLALYETPDEKFVSIHPNAELLGELACPVGAMWWANWYSDDECGPEGLGALEVMTPGGAWNMDGYSSGEGNNRRGPKWSRSGVPPSVTVNPSINIVGRYHGWVQGGVVTDPV